MITVKHLQKIFRNPFYCGLLPHRLLDGELLEGKHEKLISQKLFLLINQIQQENAHGYTHQKSDHRLPLRNYLLCASCGTHMTGYEVKKKGILYYKCNTIGCRVNKNAHQLHEKYQDLLKSFQLDNSLLTPLKEQLLVTFHQLNQQQEEETKHVKANLKAIEQKIEKLEDRYVLEGDINKEQYEKFSQKLQAEKRAMEQSLPNKQIRLSNLEKYVQFSLKMCQELPAMWVSGDFHQRQKLQKLVFPEGVAYDKENDQYRTGKLNSVFQLISCLSAENNPIKKGQTSSKTNLSLLSSP